MSSTRDPQLERQEAQAEEEEEEEEDEEEEEEEDPSLHQDELLYAGHEFFAEVSDDFIEDEFNLTGLNAQVSYYKEALDMILDVEPEEDSLKIPDVSIVESSAELLYGLIHQRFIITRLGLESMVSKFEAGDFGVCPRVFCNASYVAPCGRSDLPGVDTVKLYCPNCSDIYSPPSSRFQGVDGAFFGTTFPHMLFQTYRVLFPSVVMPQASAALPGNNPMSESDDQTAEARASRIPAGKIYHPCIYGFRVSERAKSGPRMAWLRLRPETEQELDSVDFKAKWKGIDNGGGGSGQLFEGAQDSDDDDEEEEEEEEEEDENIQQAAPGQGGPVKNATLQKEFAGEGIEDENIIFASKKIAPWAISDLDHRSGSIPVSV